MSGVGAFRVQVDRPLGRMETFVAAARREPPDETTEATLQFVALTT